MRSHTHQRRSGQTVRTILALAGVGLASALLISLMAQYAYPRIDRNREEALRHSLDRVLPEATRFKAIGSPQEPIYRASKDGQLVGYGIVGEGGGYQGVIRVLIGVAPDWESLSGLVILEHLETPGLGAKITSPGFRGQFKDLRLEPAIEGVKN